LLRVGLLRILRLLGIGLLLRVLRLLGVGLLLRVLRLRRLLGVGLLLVLLLGILLLLGVLLPVPRLPVSWLSVLPLRVLRLLLTLRVAAEREDEGRRRSEAGDGKSDGTHGFHPIGRPAHAGKKHVAGRERQSARDRLQQWDGPIQLARTPRLAGAIRAGRGGAGA
jgi:hypothetical protein